MTEKSRAVGIEEQLLQCLHCNTQFDEDDCLPTVLSAYIVLFVCSNTHKRQCIKMSKMWL